MAFIKLKFIIILSIIAFSYFLKLYNYPKNYYQKYNQIIIDNTLGNNQGIHPKIIAFDNLWNGYKYWMAYTPYPFGDSTKENPVINVSNDLKIWFSPKGIHNPLDTPNLNDINYYNSDTHLLYNNETNELELVWRYVDNINNNVTIYIIKSKNGINWSKKQVFLKSNNRKKLDFVSPVIIFDNRTYKIWYVNRKQIYYFEKKGSNITFPRKLIINYKNNYHTWHFDLIYNKEKQKYEIITCAYNNIERKAMPLFYISSKDNFDWSIPIKIMEPLPKFRRIYTDSLYRSSLIYIKGYYYLFYSALNKYNRIGLMYGNNIENLTSYI